MVAPIADTSCLVRQKHPEAEWNQVQFRARVARRRKLLSRCFAADSACRSAAAKACRHALEHPADYLKCLESAGPWNRCGNCYWPARRSEERRVGKECRSGRGRCHVKKAIS